MPHRAPGWQKYASGGSGRRRAPTHRVEVSNLVSHSSAQPPYVPQDFVQASAKWRTPYASAMGVGDSYYADWTDVKLGSLPPFLHSLIGIKTNNGDKFADGKDGVRRSMTQRPRLRPYVCALVTILRGLKGLASATRSGTTLQTVTSDTGVVLAGGVWIDGSYEGDLAAVGGAEMVWGRESKAQYNESGAGRRPASLSYKQVSPYWADGSVIPHVSNAPLAPIGGADDRMQVYTFRLCIN